MAETRPSGLPIIPDAEALITQEVAEIDERGRLHLVPRWSIRAAWLPTPLRTAEDALMIFVEPGYLSLRSWEPDGPRIVARYNELARLGAEAPREVLRLIQDRYGKLVVPVDRRPHLGDAALQHLGLPTKRGVKSSIYVVISSGQIDLLAPSYRNAKNIEGHTLLEDLP